ncbi:WG repeat-containing protein [Pedobacter sp. Leaf250]|uniref:WG repeat-containing protein n=1 Tax=Pedobacter sp. Leaf250 TaxID=2876559 RepID=UPI001E5690DF|nr:WG repeat-containing protein [Pedobacter sp. Leaf250]
MLKYIIATIILSLPFISKTICHAQELLPFRQDSLWGFRDQAGETKIVPQYKYITKFSGKYAIVSNGRLLGAIDKDNTLIIPIQHDYLANLGTDDFLFGDKSKYFGEYIMGVIHKDNTVIIPKAYSYISKTNGLYTVTKNLDSVISKNSMDDLRSVKKLYGLIANDGKTIIPCKYGYLQWVNDKLLILTKDDKWQHQALFNRKGKQLTGFEYKVIGDFKERVAKVRIEDKYGFIYPNGNLAIPVKFQYCEDFIGGYAIIREGNNWGAIDKRGNIVIKPNTDYKSVVQHLKNKYGRMQVIEEPKVDI